MAKKSKGRGFAAWLGGVSLAVLGLASGTTQAQPAPPPASVADLSEAEETVVITAERRVQNLQDVPISATVFNADMLADRGIDNVNELQQVAPSLAINTYNRSTFINIRGVGIAQSAPTSNPGVATYVDGVLIPHEQTIGQSFFDIGAVEVLRGPQGTLTGQNSTGGALYIRTPDPKFENFTASLDETVGDYDQTRTTATMNVPIGSKIAARVAGIYDKRDSFTKNLGSTKYQPGNIDMLAWRLSAAFKPLEALRFNAHYENFIVDTDHNAVKSRTDPNPNPYEINENGPSSFYQRGQRASLEGLYDFDAPMRLRYIGAFQKSFTEDISDGDRGATATNRLAYARTDFQTVTHEVNLISTGEGHLDWVVGAFYLNETIPVTLLRWNNLLALPTGLAPNSRIITFAENTTKAGFGQATWRFSPQWSVIAGARYSEDEQIYNRIVSPGGTGIKTQASTATTGHVVVNWQPDDDSLIYASVAKGYKAGGVNLTFTDPNFVPEQNVVTEIGYKRSFLDKRLQVNSSIFFSKYKDIQLASLNGALPVTQNAAGVMAYGGELEVMGNFDDYHVNAGFGYLTSTFDGASCLQNTNAPDVNYVNCANGQIVPDGSPFVFSPDWTINAGMEYDFHIGDMMLTPRVQFAHVGEQIATPFRSAATIVPGREIIDASLTFEPTDYLRVQGYVTNFEDKAYIATQLQNTSTATGGIIYGAPRQIGLRVTAKIN